MKLLCGLMYLVAFTQASTFKTCTPKRILVLGGTGFVGRAFIGEARKAGHSVVSLSRRGKLADEKDDGVTWIRGDASDKAILEKLVKSEGPFDAAVHAIGLLFDVDSGLGSFNRYASGSGSMLGASSTYDKVTRQTAFNAIEVLSKGSLSITKKQPIPFVFVSAAEAGWTFKAPVEFLERYLIAKRAVESKLLDAPSSSSPFSTNLRPIILRPSLIWTVDRPQALASVIPFYIGNAIGLPFVDKPILLSTLVNAGLAAIENPAERGIKRYPEMEALAKVWSS